VEIVRRVFEAFNSEDIGRILAFTHPDLRSVGVWTIDDRKVRRVQAYASPSEALAAARHTAAAP
jgi:hypothetical protein